MGSRMGLVFVSTRAAPRAGAAGHLRGVAPPSRLASQTEAHAGSWPSAARGIAALQAAPATAGVALATAAAAAAPRRRRAAGRQASGAVAAADVEAPSRRQGGASGKTYRFISDAEPWTSNFLDDELPTISPDGGNEKEFQEYWKFHGNPVRWSGGWLEFRSHPQVNVEQVWYNVNTEEVSYTQPADAGEPQGHTPYPPDDLEELVGEGPAWDLSVQELKDGLWDGSLGHLPADELARRAVAEYEAFKPRVQSWHDFQHYTFWFFGGMKADRKGGGSMFNRDGNQSMFLGEDFFKQAAETMLPRLHRMNPINLAYFIWTYTRAGVVLPHFMEEVGNHLCRGYLPRMDRCGIGTMVWNYSKMGVRHDKFFERAAAELSRGNRIRALAPRNFQNITIAYGRQMHLNHRLVTGMAQGIAHQLNGHRDCGPKLARDFLFAYTCKDGAEVLADSYRIGSLTVICRYMRELGVVNDDIRRCCGAMVDYAQRSCKKSPSWMREPDDALSFLVELAQFGRQAPDLDIGPLIRKVDWDLVLKEPPRGQDRRGGRQPRAGQREQNLGRLRTHLDRQGLPVPDAIKQ